MVWPSTKILDSVRTQIVEFFLNIPLRFVYKENFGAHYKIDQNFANQFPESNVREPLRPSFLVRDILGMKAKESLASPFEH